MKEQKKWLDELETKYVGDEESNEISTMTPPDLSGNNCEKDIIVTNFNVTYGGQILLEVGPICASCMARDTVSSAGKVSARQPC